MLKRQFALALAALGAALILPACTTPGAPVTIIETADPPRCEVEPAPGPLPVQNWSSLNLAKNIQQQRDRVVADYIAALRLWGQACATAAAAK